MPFIADQPALAAAIALVFVTPLAVLAGWWDLRALRIPNWLNLAIVGAFVVWAVLFLEPAEVQARALAGVAVLVVAATLFFAGAMGGGDMKMFAAAALFVPSYMMTSAMVLLSLAMMLGLLVVLPARRLAAEGTSWAGLRRGAHFPLGVSIGAALIGALALDLLVRF